MGSPTVPTFYPSEDVVAALNAKLRDPFTELLNPPAFRARRAAALNVAENVHQFLPWDTVDEDTHGGWASPTVVGGGGSTTLSAGSAAGATVLSVTSTTGFVANDYIRVDSGGNTEYRRIFSVGAGTITVGGGTPWVLAHSSGAAVVEVASDPSRYTIPTGWTGWWRVDATVSLSGTGAAGLVLIPSVAVNAASHTGVGGSGWEGTEPFIPTGAATELKHANGLWWVWAEAGQRIQIDLWFSTESAITAVDTAAGRECRIGLIWDGV